MHFYMKSSKPLLLQSIFSSKRTWESELFQVYIWKVEASGKLQRPWKRKKSPKQLILMYLDIVRRLSSKSYDGEKCP